MLGIDFRKFLQVESDKVLQIIDSVVLDHPGLMTGDPRAFVDLFLDLGLVAGDAASADSDSCVQTSPKRYGSWQGMTQLRRLA